MLNGTEKIQGLEGMDFEASAKIFSKRLKIGSSYFHGNSLLFFDIGYLIAKISDLKLLGNDIPDYDLDFSGIILISGLRYYFPIY